MRNDLGSHAQKSLGYPAGDATVVIIRQGARSGGAMVREGGLKPKAAVEVMVEAIGCDEDND